MVCGSRANGLNDPATPPALAAARGHVVTVRMDKHDRPPVSRPIGTAVGTGAHAARP
jgi:hypothetical protein